jgi:hypothetical protein
MNTLRIPPQLGTHVYIIRGVIKWVVYMDFGLNHGLVAEKVGEIKVAQKEDIRG